MIKKLIAGCVFAIFLLSLTGCGGGSTSSSSNPGGNGNGGSGSLNGSCATPGTSTPDVTSGAFFGMTIGANSGVVGFPPASVPIGAIGHPPNLAWSTIEGSKGNFDFTLYDTYVNYAQQNNLPFMMTFAYTPNWALADQSSCTILSGTACTAPPDNLQDWVDFVQAVVNHYNGTTAPHIKYYEMWNEANSITYWTGTPAQLVQMVQLAYPIIRQDPNAFIIEPSVTGGLTDAEGWLAQYYAAFAGTNFTPAECTDGVSFHGYLGSTGTSPYPFPEDDTTAYGDIVTRATQFRSTFDTNGLQSKPMFDTEGSWGDNNITLPNEQVAWVARWYLLQAGLQASSGSPLITGAYWYTWGYSTNSISPPWGQLTNVDGVTPTAAGIAYGQVYDWLLGATISPCLNSGSIYTCAVTQSGGSSAQAAWYYSTNENLSISYSVPPTFGHYLDLAGNLNTISGGVVLLGAEPILLIP
jgi:hypothetical protein